MTENSHIVLRPAGPSHIPKLIRLLPRGGKFPANTSYLAAEDPHDNNKLIGGAYLCTVKYDVAGFEINTVDPEQFTIVFPLLLRACIAQARRLSARMIAYNTPVKQNSSLEDLLQAHTFTQMYSLTEYVMETSRPMKRLDRIFHQLNKKGRIPCAASAIPLNQAPSTPVQNLVRRHLGGNLHDLELRMVYASISGDLSTVVKLGPRIIAVIILAEKDSRLEATWDVVEEGFRKRWVTVLLWQTLGHKIIDAGYDKIYFKTDETQFSSFSNFAKNMGATPLGKELRYGFCV